MSLDTLKDQNISEKTEDQYFTEGLYGKKWNQRLQISNLLYKKESEFQKISIFENPIFGRVLTLDNILQTTENDGFIYHEMLTHIPMLTHNKAKNVLIIGGGDGGMLKEVLRYPDLEKVTMVEIDGLVIDACRKYMPTLSGDAFENPKANVIVGDGIDFVKKTDEKFDIIIVDSTDPVGPGLILFTEEFYSYLKKALNENGIIVTQNGVPFFQKDELRTTYQTRKKLFKDNRFFIAPVPGYIGGFMAFGWASDISYDISIEEIEKRMSQKLTGKMKYYTPEIHKASFALPQNILDLLDS